MKSTQHQIFRARALKRYSRANEKPVLPKFITPPVFYLLWILVGLLTACAFFIAAVRVPTYADGSAFIAARPHTAEGTGSGSPVVVVLLSPESSERIRVGQMVTLQLGAQGRRISARLYEVEGETSSPHIITQRFGPGPCQTRGTAAVVALAEFEPVEGELRPTEIHEGAALHARIQTGSRRVLELLPLAGRFMGD